jgi:KaiC/GvpD/RAD55 family RecA-like ATPase
MSAGAFTNIEAEKAVIGWLCSEQGFEAIRATAPDINAGWFATLSPAFAAALAIERKDRDVTSERICEAISSESLEGMGGGVVLSPQFSRSVLEDSLHKLRSLYGKRCVAELAQDMAKGMSPAEALRLLEPLATPQGGDKLKARRFDLLNPPPIAVPRLYLGGQGICTAGNLALITGQAKTGKSAIIGATLASLLDGKEHLGIRSGKADGAVIHFDTEQSRHDHHQLIKRAMHRARVSTAPDSLRSYSLADVPTPERRALLAAEMAEAKSEHGKIALVVVDGVADLCVDPNDPAEAFGLVEELHRMAIKYDCPILTILHLNPGTLTSKSRGHLGSQLERKVEAVVQLEKDSDGNVTAWLHPARHGFLTKEQGPRFGWDEEAGMFMPIMGTRKEAKQSAKAEQEREELVRIAELVKRNGPRKATQFIQDIEGLQNISNSTAERRFAKMKATSIIHQNLNGEWEMVA